MLKAVNSDCNKTMDTFQWGFSLRKYRRTVNTKITEAFQAEAKVLKDSVETFSKLLKASYFFPF